MSERPLISIVTPVYNCAAYLRQCIESVRDQGYEPFEHIVMDGASQDGTVEILREYPHLQWVSEPDRGEAEALNKALRRARGEIIGWLNGDDYYLPGALARVAESLDPRRDRPIVYGSTRFLDDDDQLLFVREPAPELTVPVFVRYWRGLALPRQPAIFYSRQVFDEIGLFREDLHFGIDYEHWLRSAARFKWHRVDQELCVARIRAECKSAQNVDEQFRALQEISEPYVHALPAEEQRRIRRDYVWRQLVVRRMNDLRGWLKLGPRYRALTKALSGRPRPKP